MWCQMMVLDSDFLKCLLNVVSLRSDLTPIRAEVVDGWRRPVLLVDGDFTSITLPG